MLCLLDSSEIELKRRIDTHALAPDIDLLGVC